MTNQGYAKPIRILHSLLALCMLVQLAVGELMDVPEVEEQPAMASSFVIPSVYAHEGHHPSVPGAPVEETLGFEVHEVLGLVLAGLILIRVLLAFSSLPGASWGELLPWASARGRKQLFDEISAERIISPCTVRASVSPSSGGASLPCFQPAI